MKFVIIQKPDSAEVAVFVSDPPEKEQAQMVEWLKAHPPAPASGEAIAAVKR